jgi:hypothetical protein
MKGTFVFVPVKTHMNHKIYETRSAAKCRASCSLPSTLYRQTHTQTTQETRVCLKGTIAKLFIPNVLGFKLKFQVLLLSVAEKYNQVNPYL